MIGKNSHVISFTLLTVLTYLVLYYFRHVDDNRLTSWADTFGRAELLRVLAYLVPGMLLAVMFARMRFAGNHPALLLFAASFLAAVPFWHEPEIIVDSSRYFVHAKYLELYGTGFFVREWGRGIPAWTDMPFVPFLYGLIFRLFGEVRLYIQIFTTLLFSGTVVFTYAIGRKLWDANVGLVAGTLLLAIPYLYSQVPLMLVDVPSMFLLTLTIFVFLSALESGGVMVPVSAAMIFVTFFAKYSTWLMLSVLAVIFLVFTYEPFGGSRTEEPAGKGSRALRRVVIWRGILTGIFACFLIGLMFFWKREVFLGQMDLLMNYQRPGLKRWGESFISTFFFQVHPLVTAAALYSAYSALRKRDPRYLIAGWLLIIVVFLQIRRIRYVIMTFPLLSLAASYGLGQIQRKEVARFLAFGAAVSSFIVAVAVYLPFLDRISAVNLADAGELLDRIEGRYVEVFTVTPPRPVANPAVSVPILDLFTKKRIYYSYAPKIPAEAGEIETSPLRFTWEFQNPPFYGAPGPPETSSPIAVISGEEGPRVPPEIAAKIERLGHMKTFYESTGVFAYKTFVTVYY